MHESKPYGLHVIGGELTADDQAFLSTSAKRFINLKDISNLDSLRLVYDLPDGGYIVIQDMGGNFRIIAHKPIFKEQIVTDGLAKNFIPMLFSGVVSKGGLLRAGQGLALTLTEVTRRRVFNYKTDRFAPKEVRLVRFSCPYNDAFPEFLPAERIDGIIYTQYEKQRPTWYSGAMAEVMQIVGGYGKQSFNEYHDNEIEHSKIDIPAKYRDLIDADIDNVRLPAYTGIPNVNGQFQYDYKHFNTNTVGFDEQNNPWLLKIASSGVWAMPLPIVPATKSSAFRDYMVDMDDTEVLKILDRFGAMPSGESFPQDFYAWVRAGVITKVCDTADFYQHSAYSTAMGWSMNSSGNEAVNTCYDIDEYTGIFYSKAYKLNVRLGTAKDNGWLKTVSGSANSSYDANLISRYLSSLYDLIRDANDVNNAIKYKIRRSKIEAILARANLVFTEAEVDYWNNLEVEPIANHSGNITVISKGNVYRGVNIKVPEPYADGCVSLNFLPKIDNYNRLPSTAIVLAYYIEDDLKVVHYFDDPTVLEATEDTDFHECMTVGSWYKNTYSGGGYISGSIYTSDIDYREAIAPNISITTVIGKDMGFGSAIYTFPEAFKMEGGMYRNRYYSTEVNTKTIGGTYTKDAILMPYFLRNASIFAFTKGADRVTLMWSIRSDHKQDPTSYKIWTYHHVWAQIDQNTFVKRGTPYPIDAHPVYAEIEIYEPDNCSSFADEGSWVSGLPNNIENMLYGYSYNAVAGGGGRGPQPYIEPKSNQSVEKEVVTDYRLLANIMSGSDSIRTTEHSESYYTSSPDIFGGIFYIDGTKNMFGDVIYANLSESKPSGGRVRWGHTSLSDHQSAHHFIGVINE